MRGSATGVGKHLDHSRHRLENSGQVEPVKAPGGLAVVLAGTEAAYATLPAR